MGGYNESFPVSKSVNPFTRSLTYRKNAWVMNLDKDGYIDKTNNNDACMLLYRTDPQQVLGLDWIPKCPEKPGPEEKITSIQPVGVESTPSDLKVKSILLCKELKP